MTDKEIQHTLNALRVANATLARIEHMFKAMEAQPEEGDQATPEDLDGWQDWPSHVYGDEDEHRS